MEYLSPKDGDLLRSSLIRAQAADFRRETTPHRLKAEVKIALAFGLSLLLLLVLCSRALAAPVPVVRVMVEREKNKVQINGFDLVVREADTEVELGRGEGRASIPMKCSIGGRMEFTVGGRKMKSNGPLHITSMGGFIRVGSSQYRDDLYVYAFNGDCIVVNHVDIEKYVAGLLNSEMSARWGLQTLMAQAVAARTYAIHQMKEASTTKFRGLKAPFDVEGTVRDQVYEGAHQERYRAMQAVVKTRGQVLTYNGKPIKAFYHSTCGGKTESPEKVWGGRYPYLRSVKCGYCYKSPRYNWAYSINKEALERKLRQKRLVKGSLVSMRILDRNRIGRANRIEVRGTGGTMLVAATRIRDLVGNGNVRSTHFSLTNFEGKYSFIGHGSGHGVGMCQWGAKMMGDRGRTYREILEHYYPIARITRVY